ncbi:MAG: ABC transporter substrate-binding protein, partial [Planctomycetaceae bacterium]
MTKFAQQRKRNYLRLAACFALVILHGCSQVLADSAPLPDPSQSAASEGQVLRIGYLDSPYGLDPLTAVSFQEREILGLLFDTLLEPDLSGRRFIQGPLLESYQPVNGFREGPNGLPYIEYEFRLRKTASFADGTPLTAKDVVETIQTLARSNHSEIGRYLVSVTTDGAHRLIVGIREHPLPERLFTFFVTSSPNSKAALQPAQAILGRAAGTGRYKLLQRLEDGSVELGLNELAQNGSHDRPAISKIVIKNFPPSDAVAAVEQLKQGHIHMLLGLQPRSNLLLQAAPDRFEIRKWCSHSVWILAFNHRSALFQNRTARRAVLLAIDRGRFVAAQGDLAQADARPPQNVTGPYPPHSAACDSTLEQRPQNPGSRNFFSRGR